MKNELLFINNLTISVDQKTIVSECTLSVNLGSVHAIMGPNGSGKSTLALAVAGHPNYHITSGKLLFDGQDITELSADKRAQLGVFLVFQYPYAIPGVTISTFLKEAYRAVTGEKISVKDFHQLLQEKMKLLSIDHSFAQRAVNEGFSGGEKKRFEMLQALILRPRLMVIDEIDSGLDVDSLKIVADALNVLRKENPKMAIIIITHYPRILQYVTPDHVHIMHNGSLVQSGAASLAHHIERVGYNNMFNGTP